MGALAADLYNINKFFRSSHRHRIRLFCSTEREKGGGRVGGSLWYTKRRRRRRTKQKQSMLGNRHSVVARAYIKYYIRSGRSGSSLQQLMHVRLSANCIVIFTTTVRLIQSYIIYLFQAIRNSLVSPGFARR